MVHHYDICSVNIGIVSTRIESNHQNDKSILYVKPISKFTKQWELLQNEFSKNSSVLDLSIIGGGAAAFEIAIACRMLFPKNRAKIKIIAGRDGLLSDYNSRVKSYARTALENHAIEIIEGQHIVHISENQLVFENGSFLDRKICIVSTSAEAPQLFKQSNLPTNQEGFVRINKYLLIEGFDNIFAAGDCCDFEPKSLPKAGVFAVREGPILSQNILHLLTGCKPLKKYEPQNHFLTILVSGTKQAIASRGKLAYRGRLAWWLKYFIDLNFMNRYR